jgi:tRNA pseudouridine55 synthase
VTQVPPQFSAIKHDGARAYALARAGETVDLAPRQVRIDAIELLGQDENGAFDLRVTCGKGVYMRALARDLGRHLGGRAHIGGLRRVAVGPFHEKNAIGLEKLSALGHIADDLAALDACLLPLSTALDDIPALAVTAEQASRIKQGQAISLHSLDFVYEQSGPCLATLDNQPVAICETGQDRLRVLRVFNL